MKKKHDATTHIYALKKEKDKRNKKEKKEILIVMAPGGGL